jgi:16S rRNA processing protein RimM
MERTPPYLSVGRVVKAHGLKGEVSVVEAEDLPFLLREGLEVLFAPPGDYPRSCAVSGLRPGPKGILVSFEGVCDRSTAERLVGAHVMVDPNDVVIPDDEEWDPVGTLIHDRTHGDLGHVSEVIVTGANDVWVVQGSRYGEVLIPVIDEVVLEIDETSGIIQVALLPGLLPEEE